MAEPTHDAEVEKVLAAIRRLIVEGPARAAGAPGPLLLTPAQRIPSDPAPLLLPADDPPAIAAAPAPLVLRAAPPPDPIQPDPIQPDPIQPDPAQGGEAPPPGPPADAAADGPEPPPAASPPPGPLVLRADSRIAEDAPAPEPLVLGQAPAGPLLLSDPLPPAAPLPLLVLGSDQPPGEAPSPDPEAPPAGDGPPPDLDATASPGSLSDDRPSPPLPVAGEEAPDPAEGRRLPAGDATGQDHADDAAPWPDHPGPAEPLGEGPAGPLPDAAQAGEGAPLPSPPWDDPEALEPARDPAAPWEDPAAADPDRPELRARAADPTHPDPAPPDPAPSAEAAEAEVFAAILAAAAEPAPAASPVPVQGPAPPARPDLPEDPALRALVASLVREEVERELATLREQVRQEVMEALKAPA